MIRFACPGCQAVFNVADEKAGKTGKCPKCQSQFVIPAAAAAPEPSPAAYSPPPVPVPPPAADAATTEIDPCPKCGTRLSVAPTDVGNDVECPYCQTVFRAAKGGSRPPVLAPAPAKAALDFNDDEDDRPSRRKKASRRRDDDEEDDEDDDRPRRKKSRRRSRGAGMESKRVTAGILALLLGTLGVHKFYLGYTGAGVITLFLCMCTFGMAGVIPFVEGIIYLTKSDEDFIETYQVGTKEWF